MTQHDSKAVERRSETSVDNANAENEPDLYELRLLLRDGENSGEPVDGEAALREIAERHGLRLPAHVDSR